MQVKAETSILFENVFVWLFALHPYYASQISTVSIVSLSSLPISKLLILGENWKVHPM